MVCMSPTALFSNSDTPSNGAFRSQALQFTALHLQNQFTLLQYKLLCGTSPPHKNPIHALPISSAHQCTAFPQKIAVLPQREALSRNLSATIQSKLLQPLPQAPIFDQHIIQRPPIGQHTGPTITVDETSSPTKLPVKLPSRLVSTPRIFLFTTKFVN